MDGIWLVAQRTATVVRMFIGLFVMVLASFVLFIGFGTAVETLGSNIGANADIEQRQAKGTLNLIDESVRGLNSEERELKIKQYQNVFGPEFNLVEMSQLNFNSDQKERIEKNEIVVIDEVVNLDLSPTDDITDEEEKTALKATKALGLGVAGVDMLQSSKGPLVLEVNSSPGLEGIEKSTGVDIAGKIIEYCERSAGVKAKLKDKVGV